MAEDKKDQADQKKTDQTDQKTGDDKDQIDPKIAELMRDPDAVAHLLDAKRQANDEAKQLRLKLEAIDKKQKDADAAALVEQGKFKELAEKEKLEKESLKKTFTDQAIASALKIEAIKLGIVDTDGVAFADKTKITVGDDFSVKGAEEAMKALKESKAYLFSEEKKGVPAADDKKPQYSKQGKTEGNETDLSAQDLIRRGLDKKKK